MSRDVEHPLRATHQPWIHFRVEDLLFHPHRSGDEGTVGIDDGAIPNIDPLLCLGVKLVLEGEVVSQLGGQPPVTYKAGESWYEPPRIAHLMSRNASTTRPAKLLAWLVMDEGGKVKEPLPK